MFLAIRNYLTSLLEKHLAKYPTSLNLSNSWSGGFLLGIFILFQIFTGLLMVPYYRPDVDFAFDSVQHIVRNVNYGWLVKYSHEVGSTFIFLLLYFHMWRGLTSRSYKLKGGASTWISGMILYVLLMIISFLGYVLPWSQMGYWAATVISNFLTVFGEYGEQVKAWFWGGGNLSNTSLARFFCLHYGLSILLVILIFVHIAVVHKNGSSNPIGTGSVDVVRFDPSFFQKDFLVFTVLMNVFGVFVLGWPHAFAHPENFIPADPLVTPTQITPEWYFLPFYAILRSISDKTFGIIVMFGTIVTLFIIPLLDKSKSSQGDTFDKLHMVFLSLFISNIIFLGIVGAAPIAEPFINVGQCSTIAYFMLYFFVFFFIPLLEKYLHLEDVHKHTNNEDDKKKLNDDERSKYSLLPVFFLIDTYEYTNFLIFLLTAFFIGSVLTFISLYFSKFVFNNAGSKKIDKLAPYECGFMPYGDARGKFDVHFYMVGLFFIIFDLEIILILPWALNTQASGYFGLHVMLIFLVILGFGILYEWNVGALNWFFKPEDLKL